MAGKPIEVEAPRHRDAKRRNIPTAKFGRGGYDCVRFFLSRGQERSLIGQDRLSFVVMPGLDPGIHGSPDQVRR